MLSLLEEGKIVLFVRSIKQERKKENMSVSLEVIGTFSNTWDISPAQRQLANKLIKIAGDAYQPRQCEDVYDKVRFEKVVVVEGGRTQEKEIPIYTKLYENNWRDATESPQTAQEIAARLAIEIEEGSGSHKSVDETVLQRFKEQIPEEDYDSLVFLLNCCAQPGFLEKYIVQPVKSFRRRVASLGNRATATSH